jgi:hypothetical protein
MALVRVAHRTDANSAQCRFDIAAIDRENGRRRLGR